MVTDLVPVDAPSNVLDAIEPFQADDGHKGTFLVMRIAGLEQATALRIIRRKYRSIQNWRATDKDFKRVDDSISTLTPRFGGEARVIRTALLDVSIVEAGIGIFKRILNKQPIKDGEWAYATKMAGLRVPLMGALKESTSPWERIANAIKNTMSQRELTVAQAPDGTQSITAREVTIEPTAEQKQVVSDVVQRTIRQMAEEQN